MRIFFFQVSLILVILDGMIDANKLIRERDALLLELGQLNELIEGSFFAREMNGATRFCLSRVQNGKQRQAYVAARHADAVRRGLQQYAKAIEILSEIGRINFALIKKGKGGKDA